MEKTDYFLSLIERRVKDIESRATKTKKAPFNAVEIGDTIYFKKSGGMIVGKSVVFEVKFYQNLSLNGIKNILSRYGTRIGISDYKIWKDKKYISLIFIKNYQRIKPFNIDKKGFGIGCAWFSLKNIDSIRI